MVENAAAVGGAALTPPEPDSGADGDSTGPSVEETLELLSDRRDRYALHYLHQRDGIADLRGLVKQVIAWEAGDRPAPYPPERVGRTVEEFAVDRLPRLKRAGLVEYNLKTDCVVFTDAAGAMKKYLDAALEDEPFSRHPSDPFEY